MNVADWRPRATSSSTTPPRSAPHRSVLDDALRLIAKVGARRVVLDSLTGMALGVASQRRFRELVYALTKHTLVSPC